MRELFAIVQNEWIKLFRRRRFLVVLLLSLAVVTLFSVASYLDDRDREYYNSTEFRKQNAENNIRNFEESLKDPNITEEHKKNLQQSIEQEKEQLLRIEAGEDPFPQETSETLTKRLESDKQQLASLPPDQQYRKGELELSIMKTEYMLTHNILPAPYDQVEGRAWDKVANFNQIGAFILMPLLAVLLVSDMVSGEMTGGTIKLLLARPSSRGKILFGKYLTSVLATILVLFLMLAALLLTMFALYGTGNGDQPTAVNYLVTNVERTVGGMTQVDRIIDASNASIIPMSTFVFQALGLSLIASIAMTTLGFFCSVIVRSAAVSTGLAMGIAVIGTILVNVASGASWLRIFLTTHFNVASAYSGDLVNITGISTTVTESLLWLLGWTVVLYGISHLRFTKQDLLG